MQTQQTYTAKINFESFIILKVLGQGAFGKVFLGKKKDTQ